MTTTERLRRDMRRRDPRARGYTVRIARIRSRYIGGRISLERFRRCKAQLHERYWTRTSEDR